jgi:hypothetical protein
VTRAGVCAYLQKFSSMTDLTGRDTSAPIQRLPCQCRGVPSQAVPALQTPELPTALLCFRNPASVGLRLESCAKATMVSATAVRVGAALARGALAGAGAAARVGDARPFV